MFSIDIHNFVFKDIDECASNPCQNDGGCTAERPGSYSCNCIDGYGGNNCETGEKF